ncbi:putative ABC transport system permease protein [Actinomadura madurae]|uniref:Putative ABC transport system permease protein n=2 Tax=Actinomadura madurae TaxID=1993 RepID=A0A1I5YBG9_9ACTN|nr:FtsX-like permease family protein [Actinomadura madurae]SFQ41575.1 putative ABC transport system permease protein [Actinomadura madurae]
MGRVLLVFRLVLADVRRHPAQAAMLVVAVTAATAALALGLSLRGGTEKLYWQTREVTAGPDVVALSPGTDPETIKALKSLEHAPRVVAHSGPYRQYYTSLTANGSTGAAVVQVADMTPGPVDRPLVTSGGWVRPGGAVLERGFAAAMGAGVGDHVTVAGRSLPVVGVAVTAARSVYPWALGIGPGGGPSDGGGLVWLAERDTRALESPDVPVTSFINLKLRDPDEARLLNRHDPAVAPAFENTWVNMKTWQHIAEQDFVMLRNSQPILVIGSWLLSFLAVGGVATLAAGRAARQTRRVGLLKAVGATPGLIAAVLLAEYLVLALLADALGLAIAGLAAPTVVNPSASLVSTAIGPSGDTIAFTTVAAVFAAVLTTVGPTLRALRTGTVSALADTARRPRRRAWLNRVSAPLPTSLLLGLRLIARRPGRAVLYACTIATTLLAVTALLMVYVQPDRGYPGSAMATHARTAQDRHLLLGVTIAVIALALVNTITVTWTLAMEARPTMAIARAFGATPGQTAAGLSAAQLLPALSGAFAGVPLGIALVLSFSRGDVPKPPTWWLLAAAVAAVLATAALTAVPARMAARRSVARTLGAVSP